MSIFSLTLNNKNWLFPKQKLSNFRPLENLLLSWFELFRWTMRQIMWLILLALEICSYHFREKLFILVITGISRCDHLVGHNLYTKYDNIPSITLSDSKYWTRLVLKNLSIRSVTHRESYCKKLSTSNENINKIEFQTD